MDAGGDGGGSAGFDDDGGRGGGGDDDGESEGSDDSEAVDAGSADAACFDGVDTGVAGVGDGESAIGWGEDGALCAVVTKGRGDEDGACSSGVDDGALGSGGVVREKSDEVRGSEAGADGNLDAGEGGESCGDGEFTFDVGDDAFGMDGSSSCLWSISFSPSFSFRSSSCSVPSFPFSSTSSLASSSLSSSFISSSPSLASSSSRSTSGSTGGLTLCFIPDGGARTVGDRCFSAGMAVVSVSESFNEWGGVDMTRTICPPARASLMMRESSMLEVRQRDATDIYPSGV